MFDYDLSCFFEDFLNKIEDVEKWPRIKKENYLKTVKEGERQWKELQQNPELMWNEFSELLNESLEENILETKKNPNL
jgi:hypothetical protein